LTIFRLGDSRFFTLLVVSLLPAQPVTSFASGFPFLLRLTQTHHACVYRCHFRLAGY
jgi:hypothetical protein